MSKPKAEPKVVLETITPERAKSDLEKAFGRNYRPLNEDRALAISEAIRGNRYELNGETIKYNGDNTLIDGQHRLRACVMAGKPFTTFVVYNVASDANIDIGLARRFSHYLKRKGEENYQILAGGLWWLWRWQNIGVACQPPHVPHSELLRALDKNPTLRACISYVSTHVKKDIGMYAPLSAFMLLACQKDSQMAEWFIDKLGSGLEMKAQEPVFQLRKRFHEARVGDRLGVKEKVALVVKAWNLTRQGKQCQLLRWVASGPAAEDFPEIA